MSKSKIHSSLDKLINTLGNGGIDKKYLESIIKDLKRQQTLLAEFQENFSRKQKFVLRLFKHGMEEVLGVKIDSSVRKKLSTMLKDLKFLAVEDSSTSVGRTTHHHKLYKAKLQDVEVFNEKKYSIDKTCVDPFDVEFTFTLGTTTTESKEGKEGKGSDNNDRCACKLLKSYGLEGKLSPELLLIFLENVIIANYNSKYIYYDGLNYDCLFKCETSFLTD